MITISKRMLIASLTAAVCASSSIAGATVVRAPGVRPVTSQGIHTFRPFSQTGLRSTFVAGGATLPALAYEGSSALTKNPSTPTAGSIFAYFDTLTGVSTQYCQTGSGYGRKVWDGIIPVGPSSGVNGTCLPLGSTFASPDGFAAPAALGLTDPDITGSDAPIGQSDYSAFITNRGAVRGEPVQIPSIIGSIALLYNYPAGAITLKLTDSQICSLVEGKITNWSQLGFASHPLTFVGRSDGSGTTFAFSNHLSAVCGGASGLNTSSQFTPVAGTSAPYVQPNPPANFVIASGNPGVTSTIVSTAYSIGYVEAANALSAKTATIGYATVNGKDPIKNLPEAAFSFTYAGIMTTDEVVVTAGGAATVTPLSPAPVKAGCVQLPIPAKYATNTKGYPILAITNLLFGSKDNGANATNLVKFVDMLNTSADFGTGKITRVDLPTSATGTGKTGYSALGSSFNSPLETAAANCIGA